MSRYDVVHIDGRTFSVTLPDTIKFDKPATDAQAIEAITYAVAKQVLPHVQRLPERTEIVRDAGGVITETRKHLAVDRVGVAQAIGMVVAHRLLEIDL